MRLYLTFHRASSFAIAWGVLVLLCLPTHAIGRDRKKEFVSSHGFTLLYPAAWEFRGQPSHFRIDNFPISQWRKGAGLPQGGATIIVMAPRELAESMGRPMPTTMDEWIAMGTRQKDLESRRTFVITDGTKHLSITEVRTLCCAVPPYQENITWYFSVGDQLLSATLLRWQGEGAELDNLNLLRDLVLSIRVTGRSRRFERKAVAK